MVLVLFGLHLCPCLLVSLLSLLSRPAVDLTAFCGARPLPAASCTYGLRLWHWLLLVVLLLSGLCLCPCLLMSLLSRQKPPTSRPSAARGPCPPHPVRPGSVCVPVCWCWCWCWCCVGDVYLAPFVSLSVVVAIVLAPSVALSVGVGVVVSAPSMYPLLVFFLLSCFRLWHCLVLVLVGLHLCVPVCWCRCCPGRLLTSRPSAARDPCPPHPVRPGSCLWHWLLVSLVLVLWLRLC